MFRLLLRFSFGQDDFDLQRNKQNRINYTTTLGPLILKYFTVNANRIEFQSLCPQCHFRPHLYDPATFHIRFRLRQHPSSSSWQSGISGVEIVDVGTSGFFANGIATEEVVLSDFVALTLGNFSCSTCDTPSKIPK